MKVEPMHTAKKQYGTDVSRVDTTFGAFLSSLEAELESDDSYDYLTTQYSDDVAEEAFPEPIRSLLRDVPLRPQIMGNLVLQQMNLWLGKSKEGASSGLHHDFHDNLYILLKGRKRFVLFPPESVEHFDPYGELEKIHDNGLIVYKVPGSGGEEETREDGIRADGLSERDAAGLRVKSLERKMESLQGVEGSEEELEGLEEIYDEAVEQMMDFMIEEAEGADEEGEEEEDENDSYDEEEQDEQLDGVMDKIGAHLHATSKKRKADEDLDAPDAKAAKSDDDENGDGADDDDEDDDDEDDSGGLDGFEDGEDDDEEEEELKAALRAAQSSTGNPTNTAPEPSEPLSFSQIPTQELHHHLGLRKPQKTSTALSKAPKPLIVELNAGDMLYLPTSWWHEVTSFSEGDETKDEKGHAIHMALNYWFHPPDQLDNVEAPYQDELVWEYMAAKVQEAYDRLVQEEK